MYVDNITSKGVTLNSAGKSMQIEVYEKELKRLNNVINELEYWIRMNDSKDIEGNRVIYVEKLLKELKRLKEKK